MQSFVRLHGKAGVTDLCYHGDHLYTCGRNGLYCQFSVESGKVHLLTSNKVSSRSLQGYAILYSLWLVGRPSPYSVYTKYTSGNSNLSTTVKLSK